MLAALPEGKGVLFTVQMSNTADRRIAVASLETGKHRVLIESGTRPLYAASGHIVFGRAGSLWAVPFDVARLEVTGEPVSVLEGVYRERALTLSNEGTLVYIRGGASAIPSTLLWVDRQGAPQPLTEEKHDFLQPRLSPDERHIAFASTTSGQWDIWIYDLTRQTFTRLTLDMALDGRPIWTPDGERVTFASGREGSYENFYWKLADGSGPAERLTTSETGYPPTSWSPDGKVLAFTKIDPATGIDLWMLPMEGDREPHPFLQEQFDQRHPMFSPDGRSVAYTSNESGRDEIYVRPYPGPGGMLQISNQGGAQPVWARDGRELFYRQGSNLMAVSIEAEPTFSAGRPRLLFEGDYDVGNIGGSDASSNYDVTADGERFVMVKRVEPESSLRQLNVVLNWFEELKRLAPVEN
jgi:serine/threonine-protein kinase